MKNMVRNYDGGITASPAQLVYPGTVAEIQSILRDTGRYPGPVRAMGSYHSLTPCASSDGTIIDMSGMKRIVKIDRERMTFTAEAGLQFIEASWTLRAQNLQFVTNIEIGNMTLGAAACCHTKDGLDGGEFGQVGSYVIGIKWVTSSGELAQASEANEPDLLRFMRSSYGLCGVIYEVTFRIKPLEAIQFSYLPRPIEDLTEKEVDSIIDASKGLICWTVGRRAHFQTRKHVDKVGPFGSLFAASRRKLWNHTEARVGRFIDRRIPTKPLRNASLDAWFAGSKLLMSTLHLVGGATLYNPDKTIDYSRTRPSAKYAFTFWAFPRSQWLGTLREYVEFSEKHFEKYDFRCNMPLGSYFIRKDTHSILSYSHDGDIFSIDPIHAYTDKPAWDNFLKEFNEFAYKRNGIPLLNQSPFVERRHVEAAYGARWKEFSARVKEADPQRRMLNPFFADLLSG
ncbi:FAD-binding protein [Bradyrhizobium valentinum]|uniref:FAD-binding protein n=1 Tax=Bradyrhizobium valentinum TaxID=1518501 RepID=UPI000AE9B7B7|nr:FAD-binding protein [Bradyrhizobium valentinum]